MAHRGGSGTEPLQNLQALRGVACLLVVFFHVWNDTRRFGLETPILREFRWFGFAGVDLFFVLSGFLITATNLKHLGRPREAPRFLFRRFWRIYPMYWVAMIAAVATLGVINGPALFQPDVVNRFPRWLALVPVPYHEMNFFIGQAWTLSYELMFYLAFAGMICLPSRWGAVALGVWAGAILARLPGPEPTSLGESHLLSPFVLEFLGGCFVAWLASRGIREGWRTAIALGFVWAIAAVLIGRAATDEPWLIATVSHRLRVLVFGPPAMLFVYGLVSAEGTWPRRLPNWLLRAGDASYSIYLLHSSVISIAMYVGVFVPHTPFMHHLWVVGTLAAVFVVSWLAHIGIERPLLNLAKRRRTSAAPAAKYESRKAA